MKTYVILPMAAAVSHEIERSNRSHKCFRLVWSHRKNLGRPGFPGWVPSPPPSPPPSYEATPVAAPSAPFVRVRGPQRICK